MRTSVGLCNGRCSDKKSVRLLFVRLGNGHLHLIARPLSVPADIPGGDALAVAPPSGLNDALSVALHRGRSVVASRRAAAAALGTE